MEFQEVKKLGTNIKAYYNYFSLDKDTLQVWKEKLSDYDYEDVLKKLEQHLKSEEAKELPQLHYLLRGLLTTKQKQQSKGKHIVECNLCHRWMSIDEYDAHYGKCLDIEYLVNVAKSKGESIEREDIENCRQDVIDKLLKKYEPKKVENITIGNKDLKIVGG